MRSLAVVGLLFALVVGGVAFAQVNARDGIYFAEDKGFDPHSGWKEQVVVTVAGRRITNVNWNAVSNLGVPDKDTYSGDGRYGMKKASKLGLEWVQEASNVEAYLVSTQAVGFSRFNKDGTTDAISGASIHVKNFFDLVKEALAAGPVERGIYSKDGWYFEQEPNFDAKTGWKDDILLTVVNGRIVDVIWNSTNKDPKMKSKLIESEQGRYGMTKAAKKGAWYVQAAAVDQAILSVQDPAKIPVKSDGTTDAISGASIHVTAVGLAIEALKAAR